MKYQLVDSLPKSKAAQAGFACAIQIDKHRYGWHTTPARDAWRAAITACQERLGKQYKMGSKRPGKKRKWYMEERKTFTRFYFRNEAVRFLIVLDM